MATPLPTTLPDISALEAHAGAAAGPPTTPMTLLGLTLPSVLLNVHVGLHPGPEQQQFPNLVRSVNAAPKNYNTVAKKSEPKKSLPVGQKTTEVDNKTTEKKDGMRAKKNDEDNKTTEKNDGKRAKKDDVSDKTTEKKDGKRSKKTDGGNKTTEKKDGKRAKNTDARHKTTTKKDSKKSRREAAPPVLKKPARARA